MSNMTNKIMRGIPLAIELSEGGKVADKVQGARIGSFSHPKYGNIPITKDTLKSFKNNFDKKVRGVDLAIDYKHDSEAEAAGWIKGLELSEDGESLFLIVNWTPKGEQKLSEKEFRYISPDFLFDFKDNETKQSYGPTLLGAGLTNRPVIKGMEPIVQLTEGKDGLDMDKDKEIADLKAEIEKLKAAAGAGAPAPQASDVELAETKKKMGEMQAQLDEYAAKEKTASEAKALSEKTDKFAKMLSEGKAVEAQRESFLAGDLEKFTSLAQPINMSEQGHGNDGTGKGGKAGTEDAQDKVIKLAEKALADKKAEDMGGAIALVLSENAELKKEYNGY